MKNKLTLSSEKIAHIREYVCQNPSLLLNNATPSDPDLGKIVKHYDLATFLPNAEHFLGVPGSPVRRVILHRKRTAREQRSLVILCQGERWACVLKPTSYEGEPAAARKAAEIGLGPDIYLSWESLIVEQYIPGKPIKHRWYHWLTPEEFGQSLGKMLAAMHLNNLFYIDIFFPHLYLLGNGSWRLIDFGCAVYFTDSRPIDHEVILWFENKSGRILSDLDRSSLIYFLRQHDFNNLKMEIQTGIFPIPLRFSINFRSKAIDSFETSYYQEFNVRNG